VCIGPVQRFTPAQVQLGPIRSVHLRFAVFLQCGFDITFGHKRFGPAFQGIGPVGTFLMSQFELQGGTRR
jgi:hypothetical protein